MLIIGNGSYLYHLCVSGRCTRRGFMRLPSWPHHRMFANKNKMFVPLDTLSASQIVMWRFHYYGQFVTGGGPLQAATSWHIRKDDSNFELNERKYFGCPFLQSRLSEWPSEAWQSLCHHELSKTQNSDKMRSGGGDSSQPEHQSFIRSRDTATVSLSALVSVRGFRSLYHYYNHICRIRKSGTTRSDFCHICLFT